MTEETSTFEALQRDGPARIGTWKAHGRDVQTPLLLNVHSDSFPAPAWASALLVAPGIEHPEVMGKLVLTMSTNPELEPDTKDMSVGNIGLFRPLLEDEASRCSILLPDLQCNETKAVMNQKNPKIDLSGSPPIFAVVQGCVEDWAVKHKYTGHDGARTDGLKADVFVLDDALKRANSPGKFVSDIIALRKVAGPHGLIWTPGMVLPQRIAFLAWCGVDIFDDQLAVQAAVAGIRLEPDGQVSLDSHENPLQHHFPHIEECHCPGCAEDDQTTAGLIEHNRLVYRSELARVRRHIKQGTLRQYMEQRAQTEPFQVAALRLMDYLHYEAIEPHVAIKGPKFMALTGQSLHRPGIIRFQKRVIKRLKTNSDKTILLLLPCSARKPYSRSRSHQRISEILQSIKGSRVVHEVIVTSPLGLVPREMELFYPAQQYDIPVTHSWDAVEMKMLLDLLHEFLQTNTYSAILSLLPEEMSFVEAHFGMGDFSDDTSSKNPSNSTPFKELSRPEELAKTLPEMIEQYSPSPAIPPMKEYMLQDMKARAMFQFGEAAGSKLTEGAYIRGRYPALKIFKDNTQFGMIPPRRGLISLTRQGGEILAKERVYWVDIEDFVPKGSVFAVGVIDADPQIRIGDDCVVVHKDEFRGVGVAKMNGAEMKESVRGEAVKLRR